MERSARSKGCILDEVYYVCSGKHHRGAPPSMALLPLGFHLSLDSGLLSVDKELLENMMLKRPINDAYQIVTNDYIARGRYGVLKRYIDKDTRVMYAAKVIRNRLHGEWFLDNINHEIAVLMLFTSSKRIVRLHSVYRCPANTSLIFEYAAGGDLQKLLEKQATWRFPEEKVKVCMREILRGVRELHMLCIAHLDLKPQNILLMGDDIEDGIKLCDFGLTRMVGNGVHDVCDLAGTPDYAAPEVLRYTPLSISTDIWSLGVIAYVILSGHSPFGADTREETYDNVLRHRLSFPDNLFGNISSDAVNFIQNTIAMDPRERMTVDQCLEHRWLAEEETLSCHDSVPVHESTEARACQSTSHELRAVANPVLLQEHNPVVPWANGSAAAEVAHEETTLADDAASSYDGLLKLADVCSQEDASSSNDGMLALDPVYPSTLAATSQSPSQDLHPENDGTTLNGSNAASESNCYGIIITSSYSMSEESHDMGELVKECNSVSAGATCTNAVNRLADIGDSLKGIGKDEASKEMTDGSCVMVGNEQEMITIASCEDIKENLALYVGNGGSPTTNIVVAQFPDAPTKPKVSRKGLSSEQQNNSGHHRGAWQ